MCENIFAKVKKNIFARIYFNKMEKYNYIIVDDEYPSHISIHHKFKCYPNYQCVATFFNPKDALLFLKENEIDLIFLDIEMSEMNGFQFLEALQKNIFVIILTAYHEKYSFMAHQYYDKDLVFFSNKAQFAYYLPKIIARFETMYSRKEVLSRVLQLSKNEITTYPKMIKNQAIALSDIVHITVFGHHIVLKMKDGDEIIDRKSLFELLDILPSETFFQIRRNIIINIEYVTAFTNQTVYVEGQHFTISIRNQNKVVQMLKTHRNYLYNLTD